MSCISHLPLSVVLLVHFVCESPSAKSDSESISVRMQTTLTDASLLQKVARIRGTLIFQEDDTKRGICHERLQEDGGEADTATGCGLQTPPCPSTALLLTGEWRTPSYKAVFEYCAKWLESWLSHVQNPLSDALGGSTLMQSPLPFMIAGLTASLVQFATTCPRLGHFFRWLISTRRGLDSGR